MIIQRTAVRALLLAEPDLLLLSRILIPDSQLHIWIAPGGGIEQGESPEDALVREIREETNHEISSWSGPVWTRKHQFLFRGERIEQSESFYLVHTDQFEPDHTGNLDEIEHELFDQFRWWSLDAIRDSDETFVPRDLASHLKDLVLRGEPITPVLVGI